ncbi:hypothetical protein HYZ97_00335 [Candidatus Pacearchaeota archaeon]|nr:hypothetical protein [Candidatus Pacearchaeota archaeon]
MAVNISEEAADLPGVLGSLGEIALWLQAVGAIIIVWIIFQSISFYYNRKRMQEVYEIKKDMVRIERKIDNILKKR